MPSTWTIRANDRNYGPYGIEQMRGYAAEGRLAAHSLVARGSETHFQPAGEDPDLAGLFERDAPKASVQPIAPQPPSSAPRPVFFTADGDIGQTSFGRQEAAAAPPSRFIVMAEMKSRSISGLEEEMYKCGQATQIMPQGWLLASEMTINALRNTLIQKLGRLDILFIVDVSRNKAAWFNYGPEADSRIRRVWQKAQETQTAE